DVDIYVLKLASTGNVQWQKSYEGSWDSGEAGDFVTSIKQTADSGYIMVGWSGPNPMSYPNYYAWMIKLASDGSIQWLKSFTRSYHQFANDVEQTDDDGDGQKDDGYVVAGETAVPVVPTAADAFVLKLDSNGNTQWLRSYDSGPAIPQVKDIKQTSDRGYIFAANVGTDGWIVKLDVNGNQQWQKLYIGGHFNAIEQTGNNGYIVVGYTGTHPVIDGLILELDSNGLIQWQKKFGGAERDEFWSVRQEAGNSYVISGITKPSGTANRNAWMLKLDASRNIQWQRIYKSSRTYPGLFDETSDGGYIMPIGDSIFKLDANGAIQGCNLIDQSNAQASDITMTVQDLTSPTRDPGLVSESRTFNVKDSVSTVETICCY
ncbi:MAG: hypothetical protein OEQ39_15435, partial [Gammaproteobacteria bacterium]|nr:hypothetical protein [Gammaproteobacteria bacterium]